MFYVVRAGVLFRGWFLKRRSGAKPAKGQELWSRFTRPRTPNFSSSSPPSSEVQGREGEEESEVPSALNPRPASPSCVTGRWGEHCLRAQRRWGPPKPHLVQNRSECRAERPAVLAGRIKGHKSCRWSDFEAQTQTHLQGPGVPVMPSSASKSARIAGGWNHGPKAET